MPRPLILNGVPPGLAKDFWWLSATPEEAVSSPASRAPSGRLPRALSVFVLALLADVLFWEADVGLSAAVIFVIVVLEAPLGRWQRPAALLALAALPVAHKET